MVFRLFPYERTRGLLPNNGKTGARSVAGISIFNNTVSYLRFAGRKSTLQFFQIKVVFICRDHKTQRRHFFTLCGILIHD